ncbi:hypothetical protein [Proteus terrae]|uniref:hypothetical protein n=1 Tax=Proteus terrae TaxID=1574161 RepID=UPI0018C5E57A|nr:hypothetical protein [Proteus terrae]MBG2836131.1 hypothetical protein [Proteus terrae subsp. cibarius]MBG2867225.1 hypothetical protein [Proteus terrae subsp. cibarius]
MDVKPIRDNLLFGHQRFLDNNTGLTIDRSKQHFVFYPDTTYWVEPNDTIIVQAPQRLFYYYRVNVTNSDDTKVGAAIVEILD